jgi:hypothetical protein
MMHAAVRIVILGILLQAGCGAGPTAPLEMTTIDPGDDQEKIAHYYRHEAVLARQQAEELTNQAAVYVQLFGEESDWVSGTRLLVQFYEEVAREQDRLAEQHLKLGRGRFSNQPGPSRDH